MGLGAKIYFYFLGMFVGMGMMYYWTNQDQKTHKDNTNTDYEVAISIPVKDVFNVYIEDEYIDNKLYRTVIAEHNGVIISAKDCFTKAPILLPIEVEVCKQGLIKS